MIIGLVLAVAVYSIAAWLWKLTEKTPMSYEELERQDPTVCVILLTLMMPLLMGMVLTKVPKFFFTILVPISVTVWVQCRTKHPSSWAALVFINAVVDILAVLLLADWIIPKQ